MRYPYDSRPAVHSMEKFNFSHLWYALKRPCAHKKRCEKLNFSIEWTARRESLSYKSKYCNVQNSEKNYSKFEKTVVKIRPQYEQISKIPSCDWQALKNWFFTYVSFFILAIFLIHLSQERTRAKKVNNVDMQGNFRNLFILRPYFSTVFFQKFEQLYPSLG